jgi:hypothetical protein
MERWNNGMMGKEARRTVHGVRKDKEELSLEENSISIQKSDAVNPAPWAIFFNIPPFQYSTIPVIEFLYES